MRVGDPITPSETSELTEKPVTVVSRKRLSKQDVFRNFETAADEAPGLKWSRGDAAPGGSKRKFVSWEDPMLIIDDDLCEIEYDFSMLGSHCTLMGSLLPDALLPDRWLYAGPKNVVDGVMDHSMDSRSEEWLTESLTCQHVPPVLIAKHRNITAAQIFGYTDPLIRKYVKSAAEDGSVLTAEYQYLDGTLYRDMLRKHDLLRTEPPSTMSLSTMRSARRTQTHRDERPYAPPDAASISPSVNPIYHVTETCAPAPSRSLRLIREFRRLSHGEMAMHKLGADSLQRERGAQRQRMADSGRPIWLREVEVLNPHVSCRLNETFRPLTNLQRKITAIGRDRLQFHDGREALYRSLMNSSTDDDGSVYASVKTRYSDIRRAPVMVGALPTVVPADRRPMVCGNDPGSYAIRALRAPIPGGSPPSSSVLASEQCSHTNGEFQSLLSFRSRLLRQKRMSRCEGVATVDPVVETRIVRRGGATQSDQIMMPDSLIDHMIKELEKKLLRCPPGDEVPSPDCKSDDISDWNSNSDDDSGDKVAEDLAFAGSLSIDNSIDVPVDVSQRKVAPDEPEVEVKSEVHVAPVVMEGGEQEDDDDVYDEAGEPPTPERVSAPEVSIQTMRRVVKRKELKPLNLSNYQWPEPVRSVSWHEKYRTWVVRWYEKGTKSRRFKRFHIQKFNEDITAAHTAAVSFVEELKAKGHGFGKIVKAPTPGFPSVKGLAWQQKNNCWVARKTEYDKRVFKRFNPSKFHVWSDPKLAARKAALQYLGYETEGGIMGQI